eukprot:CAMPEP_0114245934 /NCGR_PEP_ID=MMETSP0058-20121206/12176_1 /TAXON_ID=36894 /ORGANISM="Pyramimonas parkeae, CCMP726" /LENGTH=394 /DNA_ID=CAMNT_0001359051 /DNA_START=192 /DNA_END=1376 /DNA_ORIENTATION=+
MTTESLKPNSLENDPEQHDELQHAMDCMRCEKPRKALKHLQQALKATQDADDRVGESDALRLLGDCHARLRETVKAKQAHKEAMAVALNVGDQCRVGWTHAAMAEVCLVNKELTQAEEHISQMMESAKADGMRDNRVALEAMHLGAKKRLVEAGMIRMAKVQEGYMDHQDRECVFDEAKVLYREAISMSEYMATMAARDEDRVYEVKALEQIVSAYQELGLTDESMERVVEVMTKALEVSRLAGDRVSELSILARLANLYEHRRLDVLKDPEIAKWYRQQLFYLLAVRYNKPTPQVCRLSGKKISVLEATKLKSETEDEITVLPECLCVYKTHNLQKWMRSPFRRSMLSSVIQRPGTCPVCNQGLPERHAVALPGDSFLDRSKVMFKSKMPGPF